MFCSIWYFCEFHKLQVNRYFHFLRIEKFYWLINWYSKLHALKVAFVVIMQWEMFQILTEFSVTWGQRKPLQTFVERMLSFDFKIIWSRKREAFPFYLSCTGMFDHSINILYIPWNMFFAQHSNYLINEILYFGKNSTDIPHNLLHNPWNSSWNLILWLQSLLFFYPKIEDVALLSLTGAPNQKTTWW